MAFKMKGHTLPGIKQSKEGKAADGRAKSSAFQKPGPPGFLGNLMKGKGALGLLNPMGAIASRMGAFGKKGRGGPGVRPAAVPGQQPVQPDGMAPPPVAPAATPAVAEEAAPMQKRKGAPKLVGKQKNIDKNKNGKIDAGDFKAMKNGPTKKSKY